MCVCLCVGVYVCACACWVRGGKRFRLYEIKEHFRKQPNPTQYITSRKGERGEREVKRERKRERERERAADSVWGPTQPTCVTLRVRLPLGWTHSTPILLIGPVRFWQAHVMGEVVEEHDVTVT